MEIGEPGVETRETARREFFEDPVVMDRVRKRLETDGISCADSLSDDEAEMFSYFVAIGDYENSTKTEALLMRDTVPDEALPDLVNMWSDYSSGGLEMDQLHAICLRESIARIANQKWSLEKFSAEEKSQMERSMITTVNVNLDAFVGHVNQDKNKNKEIILREAVLVMDAMIFCMGINCGTNDVLASELEAVCLRKLAGLKGIDKSRVDEIVKYLLKSPEDEYGSLTDKCRDSAVSYTGRIKDRLGFWETPKLPRKLARLLGRSSQRMPDIPKEAMDFDPDFTYTTKLDEVTYGATFASNGVIAMVKDYGCDGESMDIHFLPKDESKYVGNEGSEVLRMGIAGLDNLLKWCKTNGISDKTEITGRTNPRMAKVALLLGFICEVPVEIIKERIVNPADDPDEDELVINVSVGQLRQTFESDKMQRIISRFGMLDK